MEGQDIQPRLYLLTWNIYYRSLALLSSSLHFHKTSSAYWWWPCLHVSLHIETLTLTWKAWINHTHRWSTMSSVPTSPLGSSFNMGSLHCLANHSQVTQSSIYHLPFYLQFSFSQNWYFCVLYNLNDTKAFKIKSKD